MSKLISVEDAIEWELSRMSWMKLKLIIWFRLYKWFVKGVYKKYNHYQISRLFHQQEIAVDEVKQLLNQ